MNGPLICLLLYLFYNLYYYGGYILQVTYKLDLITLNGILALVNYIG